MDSSREKLLEPLQQNNRALKGKTSRNSYQGRRHLVSRDKPSGLLWQRSALITVDHVLVRNHYPVCDRQQKQGATP